MLFRSISALFIYLFFLNSVIAAECLDIFPTVSQNFRAQLILPNYKYSSEVDGNQKGSSLALSSGQYKDVKVNSNGIVYFTELNAEYRLKKLKLDDGATAIFVPGDYWIKEFDFKKNTTLAVSSSGTVRIYVEDAKFKENAHINDANGLLIFISYDDISADENLNFTGVMYADDKIDFEKEATILGSVTGDDVNLGNTLSETYQENSITNADFNSMCGSASPAITIVDYRFDECTYTGSGSEIIDQTGNYNAGINGIGESADDAQINKSLDLSATGTSDWLTLPSSVIDGLNDLTLSVWVNVDNDYSQQEIFHALGSSTNDDELEVYLSDKKDVYVKVQDLYKTLQGSITITDGQWHHILVTRANDLVCLYVDNQFQDCETGVGSGQLSVPYSNSIVIGQEQDSYGGTFDINQSFIGLMDEFNIYDQALSSAEITTLYTNELAKKNYDGTSRDAVTCNPEPFAEYRFEETSYAGVADEVIDETGSFNAVAVNGATTVGASPALSNNPGTCRYGLFNDNYIALPNSFENLQGSFTITAWINPSNIDAGSRIFTDDEFNQGGYGFTLGGPGNLRFYSRDVSPVRIITTTSIPINTWSFVTAVHNSDNKTRQIYINGQPQIVTGGGTSNTYTGSWGTDAGVATIGGETNDAAESSKRFTGSIDEVRVYKSAMSESDILAVYAETHPCEVIHHFEIVHDAQGLTCIAEPLTIKACSDEACSGTIATPTDIKIFADGVIKKTVTVIGETETSFNHLIAETVTLSSDQSYTCKNGSSTSCDIIFANAGFLLDVNSASDVSSCESVNFDIKAVKLSDTGVSCAPAFTGSQSLDFSFSYATPSTGTKVPVINGTNMANSGQIQTRTVSFSANGEASIPIEYDDAGNLSFTLSENVSSGVSSSTINKDFYPSKIVVTAKKYDDDTLLDNATSDGTPKQVAGGDFDLTFSGQCNDDTETPNYIPQSSSAVALAVKHVLPSSSSSVLGDLTVGSTIINASNSTGENWQKINTTQKESVANYSEVGVISISVKDTDYLGNVINAGGFIDVGRFYPSYFDVSITNGLFENTGTSGTTDFTYIGQPFSYTDAPILTINAKNALGDTTENYTETSFQKLTEADIIRTFPLEDTVVNGVDNTTKMVVYSTPSTADLSKLSNGVMDYTFSSSDTFTYNKDSNSEVYEFAVSYDILINSITDPDGVGINANTTVPLTVQPTGGFQRFGRLVLENSFGAETSPLAQSFEVEFLNTSGRFQHNTDDDFSVIISNDSSWSFSSATDDIVINDLLISGNDGSFSDGQFKNIELSSGSNQGAIDIKYKTPAWLQYNWTGKASNLHNEDANATATFGVYRGNDRIISWREVGN